MWVINIDPGLWQNRDMKPSVCKIALKVVTKPLHCKTWLFKTGKMGRRIQVYTTEISWGFVEAWNCDCQERPSSVKGLVF